MFCVGIPLRDTEWICRGEGSMTTTLVKFHWCLLTANFAWHFTNRKCIRRFYKRFMCFVKYSSFRSKWICIYLRFMILKHCQTIHFFNYCTLIFIIYRMSLIFTYICKDHCKIAHFNDFYLNTCLKNPLATTISLYINNNVSNVSEQFSFASSLSYRKFSNFTGIFYLFFAKEFENFERIICKEKSLFRSSSGKNTEVLS